MKEKKKRQSNPDSPARRVVPDRGSISGSGGGMSDADALAILRRKEPRSARENPDIEVVVGTEPPQAQTEFPVELLGYQAPETWTKARSPHEQSSYSTISSYKGHLGRLYDPARIVVDRADLDSPIRSVLGQMSALGLVDQVWGGGKSLRMRFLLDKSTIDVDLPHSDPDALEATIHDLIDRSLD